MKLAEALLQRSEYQKRLDNLQNRILANVKVQEKTEPLENPAELLTEAFELIERLGSLINTINARNNASSVADGQTISEAIVERDMLMRQRNILSAIVNKAQEKDYKLTHSELTINVTVSIKEIQKQLDELSQQFRQLDTAIQGVNWTTELE